MRKQVESGTFSRGFARFVEWLKTDTTVGRLKGGQAVVSVVARKCSRQKLSEQALAGTENKMATMDSASGTKRRTNTNLR